MIPKPQGLAGTLGIEEAKQMLTPAGSLPWETGHPDKKEEQMRGATKSWWLW